MPVLVLFRLRLLKNGVATIAQVATSFGSVACCMLAKGVGRRSGICDGRGADF
jgi:hypothetical protein